MNSITRLIYWLCIALITITSCTILISAWWTGQRYSQNVAQHQLERADYFLKGYFESQAVLVSTSAKGIVTDFGFRRTVADGDPATIYSMLDNHAKRVDLDVLLILDRKGHALTSLGKLEPQDSSERLYRLLEVTPNTPRIVALSNGFFWLYLSEIKAPHTVGYAISGLALNMAKLRHIHSITGLDLTLHSPVKGFAVSSNKLTQNAALLASEETWSWSLPWQRRPFISKRLESNAFPSEDIQIFMTADLSQFKQQFNRFSLNLLFVSALLVSLITLFSLIVSRRVFKPLEKLHEKLVYRASYDHLTGLHNRVTITELIALQLAEAKRTEAQFFVALLDLDHFKQVNDTHGHSAGDMVLSKAAERLKSVLREYDVLGRYGGEEFIVSASEHIEGCEARLLRLKHKIAGEAFYYKNRAIDLTISMGVCFIDFKHYKAPLSPETLIEWADQALYQAKSQGRDQIVLKILDATNVNSKTLH